MIDTRNLTYQNLLQTVPTLTESLERCHLLGGLKPEEAAFKVDIKYAHFVRMMNRNDSRHFPPDLIKQAMLVWGNHFPLDWLNHQMGLVAYPLEFMALLDEIRRSLSSDGRTVRFALRGQDEDRLVRLLEKL